MGNDSEVINAKQIYGIIILLRLYGLRSDTNRRISFFSEKNHRYRHHNVSHRSFKDGGNYGLLQQICISSNGDIILKMLEIGEDALELYDDLCNAIFPYADFRAKWHTFSIEEKM